MELPYERVIRLHKTISGERKPIRTVRVDFLCPLADIPRTIAINYTLHRIGRYDHDPTRCYNCQDWGHISKTCRVKSKKCAKCAGNHDTSECNSRVEDMKCANCQGPHPSYSRDCPSCKLAKQVDVLARTEKLSYAAATRRIKAASSATATTLTEAPAAPNANTSPLLQQQKSPHPVTVHILTL